MKKDKKIMKGKKQKNSFKRSFSPLREEAKIEHNDQNEQNEQNGQNEQVSNMNQYSSKKLQSFSSSENSKITTIFHKQDSKNVILKMKEMMNDYPEKYYKRYLKSDWVKFFINLFVALLHLIIILLYINSLNACPKSFTLNDCIEKINIYYYYKII